MLIVNVVSLQRTRDARKQKEAVCLDMHHSERRCTMELAIPHGSRAGTASPATGRPRETNVSLTDLTRERVIHFAQKLWSLLLGNAR